MIVAAPFSKATQDMAPTGGSASNAITTATVPANNSTVPNTSDSPNAVAPNSAGATADAAAPTGAKSLNDAGAPKGTALDDDVTFLAPFVYDARAGRRNPFQPPVVMDNSSTSQMLPGSPLERFDLDQIKLIGIMWNIKHPKAMFADPGGEVHVLGLDDRIGRKHGYIAAIREGEVVIVEPSQYNGQQTYSTRVLRIEQETTNAN